jgi:acetoin utilization deacetylase AcuC-like enzyme
VGRLPAVAASVGADHQLEVFWHPDVLRHDTGRGVFEAAPSPLLAVSERHPESAPRIENMKSILERGPLASHLTWSPVRLCAEAELELVHTPEYVSAIRQTAADGGRRFSATTVLAADSWPALIAAASAAMEATRAALRDGAAPAYALVRPPGHHAQPAQADGYCFFNNAALGAEVALGAGAERVAIVDFDVHHGNGTQACFWERPDVLTISLHMDHGSWGPSHPQTGSVSEVGSGPGAGFNVNVPLPLGTGDSGYELAMREIVVPLVSDYQPDLLIAAIGQDASQFDPNGRQSLTMSGFYVLGEIVRTLAQATAGGRLALIQEGGYAPTYAAFCLHATLCGALGLSSQLEDPLAFIPDSVDAAGAVARVREAIEPLRPRAFT